MSFSTIILIAIVIAIVAVIFFGVSRRSDERVIPMIKASANGDINTVNNLLRQGVNPNGKDQQGNTPLFVAANYGQSAIVKLLLDHKAKVDVVTPPNRYTPLMMAVEYIDVVRLLIENGANVNLQSSSGETALMMACHETRDSEIVKLLLNHGAKVNVRASRGRTALWLASQKGKADMVSLLINAGADLESRYEDDDSTPLIEAASQGRANVVKLLLEKGANIDAKLNTGETAFHKAQGKQYNDVVELLKKVGAK
jgi:ankyrin repeat protein